MVGTNTVTATATGLPSVTFNATGTAGAPAKVVAIAGNNQTAVQGTSVATPPAVRVTDGSGNPVIGAAVTFAVTAGGGSATGLSQVTDTQGEAAVGSWTLGYQLHPTLTATVAGSGITGNPVTFTAQSATRDRQSPQCRAAAVTLGDDFDDHRPVEELLQLRRRRCGRTADHRHRVGRRNAGRHADAGHERQRRSELHAAQRDRHGRAPARSRSRARALPSATTASITFN